MLPGSAWRASTTASTGLVICSRASRALAASTAASACATRAAAMAGSMPLAWFDSACTRADASALRAVSSVRRASSSFCWEKNPCATSSPARWCSRSATLKAASACTTAWLVTGAVTVACWVARPRASTSAARACCSAARASASDRRISRSPAFTRSPSRTRTSTTVAVTSAPRSMRAGALSRPVATTDCTMPVRTTGATCTWVPRWLASAAATATATTARPTAPHLKRGFMPIG